MHTAQLNTGPSREESVFIQEVGSGLTEGTFSVLQIKLLGCVNSTFPSLWSLSEGRTEARLHLYCLNVLNQYALEIK
jgi:hypothetical protein